MTVYSITLQWILAAIAKFAYHYTSKNQSLGSDMHGINRNMAMKLLRLLKNFPVVAVLGARQVGKTTLAKQVKPDWHYVDLEQARDYERVSHDPAFFFEQHPQDVIIDEAQSYPALFETLRGVIDAQRQQKGRFIITGSSSPELTKRISESLAGRIAIIRLGTLKANECYQQPLSDFYQLFAEPISDKNLITNTPPISNEKMQRVWLRGGYPEPVLQQDTLYFHQWMDSYQDTYINRDIANLFPRLNKITYQRFIAMLGKLSGTILNKRDIARALEVSETTSREYIHIAEQTFLWRQLASFEKNTIKSVIKMPKGQLRDTGLLHHFLKISAIEQLYNDPNVGHSFETFVVEEIIKGLEATLVTNWQPYYYRTRNGAEIDLILEGPFGLLPIEIKYGSHTRLKQLTTLEKFVQQRQLPFGLLINQSQRVEWLSRSIVQIPVGWL